MTSSIELFGRNVWDRRALDGAVDVTPVGMAGNPGTPVPAPLLKGARWAFDAVYTPVDTRFKLEAEAAGLDVLSSYELFFHQGVHAFEIFSGQPFDRVAELRAAMLTGRPLQ